MEWNLFVAGCVGAIAPEIVRLYEVRNDTNLKFSTFYFIISLAYVLLGGYIASIFPGLTGEFYAGCIGAGLVLVVNKMIAIGGLLAGVERRRAQAQSGPAGSEPAKTPKEDSGFARRTSNTSVQRATLMDYINKL